MRDVAEIREFQGSDLDAIVELSLRAWEPVFVSLREVLGDEIFVRLKPDWKAAQAEEVKASCTSDERDAFVALAHVRQCGMDIAAVETGGDPGHAPARAAYEALGFTLLPVARYLKLLDQ